MTDLATATNSMMTTTTLLAYGAGITTRFGSLQYEACGWAILAMHHGVTGKQVRASLKGASFAGKVTTIADNLLTLKMIDVGAVILDDVPVSPDDANYMTECVNAMVRTIRKTMAANGIADFGKGFYDFLSAKVNPSAEVTIPLVQNVKPDEIVTNNKTDKPETDKPETDLLPPPNVVQSFVALLGAATDDEVKEMLDIAQSEYLARRDARRLAAAA